MIEIYETLDTVNEDGKYYNVYTVPASLPVSSPFTRLTPDAKLINPRFDWLKGEWVSDEVSVLNERITDLEKRLKELEELSK